jgi:signal transduction histidine kinase
MRQLFQNLIGNALKFSKKDVSPIVKVMGDHAGNTDGSYQITIEDNGIGFDEKYTNRIFGVFQRLHGRSEYEGTGIGLSVCKKIVERHGGTITARSKVGQGTSFIVILPSQQKSDKNGSGNEGFKPKLLKSS